MNVIFSSTLILWWSKAVVFLHEGSVCNANTTESTTTESYSTNYQPMPELGNKNLSLTVLFNETVTLNCSFDATSEKRILWWFNEGLIFSGNMPISKEITNIRTDANATTSYLHIEGFQSNNTGSYECKRGRNQTGLYASLHIRRPLTELSLVFVNGSLTNPTDITLTNNESYIFRCFGNELSSDPFIWEKDNKTIDPMYTSTLHPNLTYVSDETNYFGSELVLHVEGKIEVIACQTGNHRISVLIDVNSHPPPLLELRLFFLGFGGFAIIVLLLASVCYCVCTFGGHKDKKPTSRHSSIYSMPSLTSNDHSDSTEYRKSRGDRDVDPITQHATADTLNTLERDWNKYGIQLHSLKSKDDLNEFWEASLCGGSFNERMIVRSLSGKATVDLLEEFRKFMISLQDLPSHPNIWSVLGISKEKLPYRICYQYHDQTTVREYLLGNFQSHGDSPCNQTQTLVFLAYDIVDAMIFLKSYAFDHVAIRTEKILLDNTENCKLYDFCLSSQSQEIALNAVKEDQILPWLAPELIFLEEYNQWTDIWAFGVVLWELWCGGRTPHCGKSRENLEKDLRNQQFLVQPPNCPGAVYSLMLSCWKNNASERKMFTDLKKAIDDLKTATESRWYGPEDYSTVGSSSFYTVLDNTYDAQ